MTDDRNDTAASGEDRDEAVELLMSIAGQRTAIPPGAEARVRASVEREWRERTSVRRTMRWAVPMTLAASVVLAATLLVREPAPEPVAIGSVARIGSAASGMATGQRLFVGDRLSVPADGGLSFDLGDRTSVRLAPGAVLDIDGLRAFTLVSGRVYVDTGDTIYRGRPVSIETALGRVTDVGTQFVVGLGGDELRVAVREGEVDIATDDGQLSAAAGQRVILAADVTPVVERVAATDEEWAWAEALAPRFDLDGRSVLDFLKWVARETGMELEFPVEDDRRAAMSAILSGSIDDLTPMEALASVMPTTRFNYVIDGDAISVTR